MVVRRPRSPHIKATTSAINSIALKCSLKVYVVPREDLIILKIAWAKDSRFKVQERAVRNLLATDHDEDDVEHWLRELDLHDFAERWLA
ncbi:hypothetical protein [Salinibacter ruber]|uniref:Uncharacterized protein n=1 Tax=Salinibacter ruber (strain DSM 13855 / M31) TaxID=309807 RepID=Q2S637_SALRD|nr:hypothetical protein [Salinibacter ruber]ABC43935.1 hypothetical protein SRU_0193 [Salinibacter ruber DSM 13855]MBB4062442.1 hypothetical protein [Salinibacter ruber]MCS4034742.1 hypothetical protein [Salinibacter ruber]MCS4191682.1 hypothetical protein [Salinibacter ruber]